MKSTHCCQANYHALSVELTVSQTTKLKPYHLSVRLESLCFDFRTALITIKEDDFTDLMIEKKQLAITTGSAANPCQ